MSDPFEQFEDQLYSHDLLEQHGPTLAREAQGIAGENPGAEPVGLILDAESAEGQPLIEALKQSSEEPLDVTCFVGVVPRAFAVHMIRGNCPAALDSLPVGELGARLPVLIATRRGFRFGSLEYSV